MLRWPASAGPPPPSSCRIQDEYAGIASRLKKLANIEVHDQAVPPSYSRREAQFVIGTTEYLIGLIAEGTTKE